MQEVYEMIPKSESEQHDAVWIRISKKDFLLVQNFAQRHDGRNSFVKFLRNTFVTWKKGVVLMTKSDVCILHVVASLTDGRKPVNKIIRSDISPTAIRILRSWR